MFLEGYHGKPATSGENSLPWYKNYGFNTEQEFEQWWAKYGAKIKLKFPAVSAGQYPSYEEYLQKQSIDSAKKAFQSPSAGLFGKNLQIKTSNGTTWTFVTWDRRAALYGDYIGLFRSNPADALYALCWLAASPLIISIEASDQVIELPYIYDVVRSFQKIVELGRAGIVRAEAFPAFWIWIMSGRIPITLTQIDVNFPLADHPPVVPPPYPITPSVSSSSPTTGGTTSGSTTTGGTTAGGTTTGGTSIGGTTTGSTTTTAVVKSALPYVAIGAGVLLLLWAMNK
jgi:hypothetical protein